MPGTKEIRVKIKSVQNTRKITKAMEMVAASKMRKAQERMRHARPYAEKIRNVAAHCRMRTRNTAPFLVDRDSVKRSADRRHHRQGLQRPEYQFAARCCSAGVAAQGVEVEVCASATRARLHAAPRGDIVSQVVQPATGRRWTS